MKYTVAVGQRFGRLTVVRDLGQAPMGAAAKRRRHWECVCDCGSVTTTPQTYLVGGDTRSCGCLKAEVIAAGAHTQHLGSGTPEYFSWAGMLQRCHTPTCNAYADYGGRGIVVCGRWRESFAAFRDDVGLRPAPGYTIDRIDNSLGYMPGNVKWSTKKEQANNRRPRRWYKRPTPRNPGAVHHPEESEPTSEDRQDPPG